MANLHQALQKATFATLSNADKLLILKARDNSASLSVNVHEMLGNCIDTVALLSHAVTEISQLRREKLKPSLKSEYHILCSAVVAPESKLLFGDDLAKQIRDRNETNRIGNTSRWQNVTRECNALNIPGTTNTKITKAVPVDLATDNLIFGRVIRRRSANNKTHKPGAGRNNEVFGKNEIKGRQILGFC